MKKIETLNDFFVVEIQTKILMLHSPQLAHSSWMFSVT